MLAWARTNPMLARVGLRFLLRLMIAVILVLPLQALGARFGISPNYGLVVAVVIALVVGARLANQQADRWGIPREHGP